MFETRASRNAESVLGALSQLMQETRVRIPTPSGESMLSVRGLFADGSAVLAPGIDECSSRRRATVVSTGVRQGWNGRWCLVHYRGDHGHALVREEDLVGALDAGRGFEGMHRSGGRATTLDRVAAPRLA